MIRPLLLACFFLPLALLPATAATSPTSAPQVQQALRQLLVQKLGQAPRPDPALNAAASENCAALAEVGTLSGSSGYSSYLRFLLRRRRVRDAVVSATAVRGPDATSLARKLRPFLEQHASQRVTHYGLGLSQADGELVATVILVRRQVEIHALRAVLVRPLQVCARVLAGWRPQVLITTPEGNVIHRAPPGRRENFCVRLPRAHKGRYEVEVMVDGPLGPEVAALFPLFLGIPEPQLPEEKLFPKPKLKQEAVKETLLSLINRSRKERSLKPLQPLASLDQIAQAHSNDMRDHGFFGHRSPRRGTLEQRLARNKVTYRAAAENLALSTSAFKAHEALMQSPSHRQNILDPQATQLGLGVALDSERQLLYITECFAQLDE